MVLSPFLSSSKTGTVRFFRHTHSAMGLYRFIALKRMGPSERRCCQAFGWGVKSPALIRPWRKPGSRALPPSSSRGLFWFLSVHTTTGYVSREPSFFTTTVTTITTFFCCRGNPVVCVVCHFVTSIRCARSSCCFCCLCCR